jgi:integrase
MPHSDKMSSESSITPEDEDRVMDYKKDQLSPRSQETYQYSWDLFEEEFCEERGAQALPADSRLVAAYLAKRAEQWTTSTVQRDYLAISWKHRINNFDDPTNSRDVSRVMKGVHQRADPDEGTGKRKPLLTKHIKDIIASLPLDPASAEEGTWAVAMYRRALRNRALILIGYAGAFRASEVAEVRVEDITPKSGGVEIRIPDTKTTPRVVGISRGEDDRYCPVRSLRVWTEAVDIDSGPVFRRVYNSAELATCAIHRKTVWRVVVDAAEDAGIDPEQVGAHSLRRGHLTQAALNGVSLERLRRHAGHKDPGTTAEYIQDARRMDQETSQELGL